MNFHARTDLACEGIDEDRIGGAAQQVRREQVGPFMLLEMTVPPSEAGETPPMAPGSYLTVECGKLVMMGEEDEDLLIRLLAGKLRGMAQRLTGKPADASFGVFVAGLGNAEMTADAIGPKTVGYLTATRHLREHEQGLYRSIGCSALSLLAPGVLGQTGMETCELLKSVVECIHPDVVIAVDALAARDCNRLASTVQLSDAGISPGSGVGNHRAALTRETLGVPVLALGVPTVVDSATLVYDALREAGIREIGEPLTRVLETGKHFFVSPKESDVITERVARLLSSSIAAAFTGL
ncbi:MAG: GPR endopeptidase [Clostridia bacterium]|nr:GPR endopeptidase [Clostridia bacterium]